MSDCFIGVDVGTSGCRAIAIDAHGGILAKTFTGLEPPIKTDDGGSRQDPELWWKALLAVLQGLGAKLAEHRPRSLCLDATATSLLLSNEAARSAGQALMYDDLSSVRQATLVKQKAPADCPVHGPAASLSKLLALHEQCDARAFPYPLHQADWLLGRLCGRMGISDWNNALKLGYDPELERWPDWLTELVPPHIRLPEVYRPGSRVGRLSQECAELTGLPADLTICAGTTDSTAAVLASGAALPGDAVSVLGSTLVMKIVSEKRLDAPELGIYSHRLGDFWLCGGASNSGGAILRYFFDDAQIRELSLEVDPNRPTGLDFYPLLRPGERFPVNDPHWSPRMTPRPHSDLMFFQALLEGMAAIEALAYERLQTLGAGRPTRIISIGGGAVNAAWRQIRQRFTGIPVVASERSEPAYGAAVLAKDTAFSLPDSAHPCAEANVPSN